MKRPLINLLLLLVLNSIFCQENEFNWEQINAAQPPIQYLGKVTLKHSKEIESSPWSVGCETLDRDYARFEEYKDYVGQLGVKYARLQSGWAKCEKEKGIYNFQWLDSCVYGLKEQGVNPWISLSYGNSLYNSGQDFGSGIFTAPETMSAWCNYVEAIVKRYKGIVNEWEIWNEPMPNESPEAYANLLIKTTETIKKTHPQATIIGFTVHGFTKNVLKFPKAVYEILRQKDKTNIIDYVSYHPYNYNPDESYPMVDDLKKMAESYYPDVKLYQGECGAPSEYCETKALNKYTWTELSQAKWNLRRMLGDYARDIRTSIFTIIDLKYQDEMNRKGLIYVNDDKTVKYPKSTYYAIQHLTAIIDSNLKPQGMLQYETDSERNLTVAGFQDSKGQQAVVLWYDDQIPDNSLEWDNINITLKNTQLKNPVWVDFLTGKVYQLDKKIWKNKNGETQFSKLFVWDSPIIIIEKELVSYR